MADSLHEFTVVAQDSVFDAITVENNTGAELAPHEIWHRNTDDGRQIALGSLETIAAGENGSSVYKGEIKVSAQKADTFDVLDPVYWDNTNNRAVTYANMANADFMLGRCTKASSSSDDFVYVELNHGGETASSISSSSKSKSSTSSSSVSSSLSTYGSVSSSSVSSSSESSSSVSKA
jgi:hypothetical protein